MRFPDMASDFDKGEVEEMVISAGAFLKNQAIEKAILFGLYARGEAKEDSDIDLILVSKEFEGKSPLQGEKFWLLRKWGIFGVLTHR
jgi:predicted nucleotidyltransferase